MKSCPTCGDPLGAGALDGMCPKCLVKRTESAAQSTEPAAVGGRVAEAVRMAAVGGPPRGHVALHSDLPSAGQTSPFTDGAVDLGLDDPDSAARAARDAAGRDVTTRQDRPAPPLPRIEGYEILRELTHGGQGVVYLAVQRSTKRKVAIKVLLAGRYASRSARHRFEREIELVASLKHPNIIAVFDSGTTEDGYEYYVMDYVRGVPATRYVRDRKLSLDETLALFATVCDAVNHAHQRGVIHRDLKPSNVLVDVDGNLRVLDFGLAKAMTDPVESQASVTGNLVGTLPYMSPEQTRGNPDEIDTRTDVYALGVMLYEMLTGRHPYPTEGAMADVVRNITDAAPGRPSRSWTSEGGVRARSHGAFGTRPNHCPLDFEIDTIALKALAKDREQRYDSAGQFARDLRRYLNGEQIVARRASVWYQLRVFSRRNKAVVGAVAAVLLVLLLATAAVTWQWRRAEKMRVQAEADGSRAARAAEALGNYMAFGGDDAADGKDLFAARRLYTTALEHTWKQQHPGTSILMGLLEIGSRPDGRIPLLGSYGRDGGASAFRVHTRHPNNVAVLETTGTALTSGTDGQLILWDLLTGRALHTDPARAADSPNKLSLSYVATSPNEQFAAVAGNDGLVEIFSLGPSSFGRTGVTLRHDESVWMVAITDDRRVLTGTEKGRIVLWDGRTGQLLHEYEKIQEGHASAAGLAFLPTNPRYALSGHGNGKIRLWDLEQDTPIDEFSGEHRPNHQINSVGFSRDGTKAFTASFDGTITVWEVRHEAGAMRFVQASRLVGHTGQVWRAAFSPGGDRVASASSDRTVRVWDAATGAELFVFRGQARDVNGVAFGGPDTVVCTGDSLVDDSGKLTSSLKVWDLRDRDGPDASINGHVAAIDVKNSGEVTIRTDDGNRVLYIGEDGGLHDGVTPQGPAARPVVPHGYEQMANRPSWASGGRSSRTSGSTTGAASTGKDLILLAPGKMKLVGCSDGKIQLWGAVGAGSVGGQGQFDLLRSFEGHKTQVDAAGISPDGRFIVSVDKSGIVKAWDVMRPARYHELEREVSLASELLDRAPGNADALASFRKWYAFRGRDDLLKALSSRSPAAAR